MNTILKNIIDDKLNIDQELLFTNYDENNYNFDRINGTNLKKLIQFLKKILINYYDDIKFFIIVNMCDYEDNVNILTEEQEKHIEETCFSKTEIRFRHQVRRIEQEIIGKKKKLLNDIQNEINIYKEYSIHNYHHRYLKYTCRIYTNYNFMIEIKKTDDVQVNHNCKINFIFLDTSKIETVKLFNRNIRNRLYKRFIKKDDIEDEILMYNCTKTDHYAMNIVYLEDYEKISTFNNIFENNIVRKMDEIHPSIYIEYFYNYNPTKKIFIENNIEDKVEEQKTDETNIYNDELLELKNQIKFLKEQNNNLTEKIRRKNNKINKLKLKIQSQIQSMNK